MPFRLANIAGRAALVEGEEFYDLESISRGTLPSDPMAALETHAELHSLTAALGERVADGLIAQADLGPPVPAPRSVFGIGLNYADHIAETGRDLPVAPVVFTKFAGSVSGPHDDIELVGDTVDYEVELVVVVGAISRNVSAVDAWEHVAGVMVGQDISDRTLQMAASPPQFNLGKSRRGYGPTGPLLVSPDCFEDRDDIALSCAVNGEQRQSSSTRHLVFGVPALIEYLSGILTLQPGDLIFTGTPGGVGAASGRFLSPGDLITSHIDRIGTLTNRCV